MLISESDRKSSPLIGKSRRGNLSWILYSALVVSISMLIGWVAHKLARMFEEFGVEVSGMTRMVFALAKAQWISIPIWLAISMGAALAIHHYSEKPKRYIFLLNIIMILLAVFIVVVLCCALFSSN
jgi:hypothetical protein